MGTMDLGIVGYEPKGQYLSNVQYEYLNIVTDGGSSYAYINPTPAAGVPVTYTSHWQQITEKGDTGEVSTAQMTAAIGAAIAPVNAQLAETKAQVYSVSEMPLWFDRWTDERPSGYISPEILDVESYGLVAQYGTSGKLYALNLSTLQFKYLGTAKVAGDTNNPSWYCGKILPRYGADYDALFMWDRNNLHVTRVLTNGQISKNFPNQKLGWLRNQGIDISIDAYGYTAGTIIYAEYYLPEFNSGVDTVHVYRSTDLGITWTSVFQKNCRHHAVSPEVFHFHYVRKDPYNPGHWYLGGGDIAEECNMWRSTDDGLTWTKINDLRFTGRLQAIHRTCDLFFTEDYIYWGTDDHLPDLEGYTDAVWCKSPRNLDTNELTIEVLADLHEQVRLTIQTPFGVLLATEDHLRGNSWIWIAPYDDLDHPVMICKHEISFANQVMKHSYGTRWFAATAYRGNYPRASTDSRTHVFDINRLSRS